MNDLLRANIETNLVFYRRNRLLVAAAFFLVVVMGLTSLPAFLFTSRSQHLEQVQIVLRILNGFGTVVSVGLGLMLVSQHIRDRSVKMVFTKPCPPETWLLASFLSAAIVAFALFAGALLIASVLFLAWGIPFQTGAVYVVVDGFFQAVSLMAFATFLSVIFHPVLSVLVLLVFREGLFYWFKVMLAGGITAAGESRYAPLLRLLKMVVDAVYFVWPTFSPYETRMGKTFSTLRGSDADWTALGLAVLYALVLSALFYLLTVAVLKRKRYV